MIISNDTSIILPDRLKVGRRSLKAKILVRFQVRQQKKRSDILLPDSKMWDILRLESNAGAGPVRFIRERGGAQTKLFDEKVLVEGDKCTHGPSRPTKKRLSPLRFRNDLHHYI